MPATLIDNTPVRSLFELPSGLPQRTARVVIVGGGIIGCSVAYHLAKAGWKDVVLLEQGRLSSGTTWHAAGMVGQLRASNSMTQINKYSAWLYPRLQEETGHDVGWVQTRGLTLGTNAERMIQLRRTAAMAEVFGVEAHLVGPREAQELWPLIQVEDVLGAVYLPGDGRVIPGECAVALAKGAIQNGAQLFDQVRVTRLNTRPSPHGKQDFTRITGVEYQSEDGTSGKIEADWVILTGGIWTRQLGLAINVDLPLYPVEHHYVLSEPIPGAARDLPCARDPDAAIYFRTLDDGSIKLGAFQWRSKPWQVDESVPGDFAFSLLNDDWEKFAEPLAAGQHRIPALRTAKFPKFVNGPESFTPDNNFLMGPPARTEGLFVLAGFNSVGIASAGGAGKYTVDWLEGGEMPMDLWSVDVRRFALLQNGSGYLMTRAAEVLGLHYQMAWPNREMETSRNARRSPLHEITSALGACYGQTAGWERPLWYAPNGVKPEIQYSFKKQNWAPYVSAEVKACRERAAIFDQSTFAKFELSGADALATLQFLCGNDVDVPVGRIVYTAMFNERGTFASDLTVVRLAMDRFYLITSTQQAAHDADWILQHVPVGADLTLTDVTSDLGVVSIMGPASRRIFSQVTSTDISNTAFPFGHSAEIKVGGQLVRALRVTYVGELGWELHGAAAVMAGVWEELMKAGAQENIRPAGTYAINTMRIEKAYRAFGTELSVDENPFQAGLSFAIAWHKEFLGKEKLRRMKDQPLRKRMVSLALDVTDPTVTLWGNEPVFRDGKLVGYTSSGCFSPTLGKPLALAYIKRPGGGPVDKAYLADGTYTILQDGIHWPASLNLQPPVDPKRERVLI
ncbi:MAG: FAD-dependent oxidoreductase [Verrucomicrobiota bacterium]